MLYNGESWRNAVEAFEQAATWFVATTAAARGRWQEDGLGEWSVRDLVGHTSRALLTVEAYLDQGASTVEVGSPVEYFRFVLAAAGDPTSVAQRGRDAGVRLGEDPVSAVEAIAERVLLRVRCADQNTPVSTPVGGMHLAGYLPTRTFELTVHTCDLAAALGQPLDVPPVAAAASLTLLGGLAAEAGLAGSLLLAGTGRRNLPDGYTVL